MSAVELVNPGINIKQLNLDFKRNESNMRHDVYSLFKESDWEKINSELSAVRNTSLTDSIEWLYHIKIINPNFNSNIVKENSEIRTYLNFYQNNGAQLAKIAELRYLGKDVPLTLNHKNKVINHGRWILKEVLEKRSHCFMFSEHLLRMKMLGINEKKLFKKSDLFKFLDLVNDIDPDRVGKDLINHIAIRAMDSKLEPEIEILQIDNFYNNLKDNIKKGQYSSALARGSELILYSTDYFKLGELKLVKSKKNIFEKLLNHKVIPLERNFA